MSISRPNDAVSCPIKRLLRLMGVVTFFFCYPFNARSIQIDLPLGPLAVALLTAPTPYMYMTVY